MHSQKVNMLHAGLIIVVLIIIGKILSFGKDIVISSYFGASSDTDAFFVATNITSILFIAFYSTISAVFLPLYNEIYIKNNVSITNNFTSNIMNIYLIIALLINIFSAIYAPEIVQLVATNFGENSKSLAADLVRIMSFSFMFSTYISFMTTIQYSHQEYLPTHFIPIINNFFVTIALILFSSKFGIYTAAVAGIVAWFIQVPMHRKLVGNKFSYKLYISCKDKNFLKMVILFIPAFLSVFVNQMNIMVDTALASSLEIGNISSLNFANRLANFASGIFIMAVISIMYPIFSKHIVKNEYTSLHQSLNKVIRILILLINPILGIIFVYHYEIVSIVFERGKFNASATKTTSLIFVYYAIGILFLALRELFNKVYYAKQDTKTPLIISSVSVAINIFLSIVLMKYMAANGLALATSISLFFCIVIQLILLYRKIGNEFLTGLFSLLIQSFFITGVMFIIIYFFKLNFTIGNIHIEFISGSIIGLSSYIGLLFFFKNKELCHLQMLISQKIKLVK